MLALLRRLRMPLALTVLVFVVASPASAVPAPTASVTWDTRGFADGEDAARSQGEVSDDRAYARLDSAAGWQFVDVRVACLTPEGHSQCDNEVNCEPGTANCWATSRPRPDFPCRWVPPSNGNEGYIVCEFPEPEPDPEPEPGPQVPACRDAFSGGVCDRAPEPREPPAETCGRLFAPAVCSALPAMPDPRAACREVFAERVCASADALPAL